MNWEELYADGVRRNLDYPSESILDAFDRAVEQVGEQQCTGFLGKDRTYSDISAEADLVASGLAKLGVRTGDRVAIALPTCPQNLVAMIATYRLGATVVQHNPLYTAEELEPLFADHGAKVAFFWDSAVPVAQALREKTPLEHVVAVNLTDELPTAKKFALRLPIGPLKAARAKLTTPVDDPTVLTWKGMQSRQALPADIRRPEADDVAVILYTSGTTGTAKGVPLTHANLLANCRQGIEWAQLKYGQDAFLAALPMFHALGLTVSVLVAIVGGAAILMVPTPDPQLMMQAVKRRTPTFITGVPPLFKALHEAAATKKVSLRGINYSLSGAMPLPAEFVATWEQATGGRLIEGYGLTECAPIAVGNPLNSSRRPGAIGVPFPDTEIRVVDIEHPTQEVAPGEEGELLIRGPQVFGGYLGRPEATESAFVDGWFRTGDLVRVEDGFLVVTGRLKELIVTGGFNVSPIEVEDALRKHPAIDDVAVVGMPSSRAGEDVVAAVIGANIPSADELRAWAKQHLTAYKVPRRFEQLDELPTNAMGKIVRREVAELLHRRD